MVLKYYLLFFLFRLLEVIPLSGDLAATPKLLTRRKGFLGDSCQTTRRRDKVARELLIRYISSSTWA